MKKLFAIILAVTVALGAVSCTGAKSYKDGTYTAEAADFDATNGWKDNVTIVVASGKIIGANWNGTNKAGGVDKKTSSESGAYGMKANGKSLAEWHEEAAVMEAELIKVQDPAKLKTTSDGYAQGVSGVTIHVNGFLDLTKKALEKAK